MTISNNEADLVLDAQMRNISYLQTTLWLGLSSTLPNPDGTGITEPTGGGYGRVEVPTSSWNNAGFDGNPGEIWTNALITFAAATADWLAGADLRVAILFTASTGGNVVVYGNLDVPFSVLSGTVVTFTAESLKIIGG